MKKAILLSILILSVFICFGQSIESLSTIRLNKQKTGMLILGSWAALNIISSPILSRNSSGNMKYFHQMNGYWNSVNLVIAGVGYYTASGQLEGPLDWASAFNEQIKLEKILLFNAGLDIGYIGAGFYLAERSKTMVKNPDRLKGFGQSLILQGSFLLVFDSLFYIALKQTDSQWLELAQNVAVGPNGISMSYRF